jgi:uncharacterized protein involved in response to NO
MQTSISAEPTSTQRVSVVLAYGFRPFFLAAAVWAIASIALWVAALAGILPSWLGALDLPWHEHEMLFSVFGAAIAGFVLTAFPEWTKSPPLTGSSLGLLVGLWAAGRAIMLLGMVRPAAVLIAAAFLATVASIAATAVIATRSTRLWPFVISLASFAGLSAVWQLARAGVLAIEPTTFAVPSLLILTALVTLASGRIVPIVSQVALLRARSERRLSAEPASTEVAAGMLLLVAALILVDASPAVVGWVACAAAAAQVHRTAEWWIGLAGLRAYIWPLHLSSLLIAAAAAALGLDRLGIELPASSIVHMLALGGAALATLSVMTIAGLLHTGHRLEVPIAVAAAMVTMVAATVLRAVAPLLAGSASTYAVGLAGSAFVMSFFLYLLALGPKLLRPRVDGKPG